MTVDIKFYKFSNISTGEVQVGIGHVYTRVVGDKDSGSSTKVTSNIPAGDNVTEITEEEFNALDAAAPATAQILRGPIGHIARRLRLGKKNFRVGKQPEEESTAVPVLYVKDETLTPFEK
jgi:hypothetical protein